VKKKYNSKLWNELYANKYCFIQHIKWHRTIDYDFVDIRDTVYIAHIPCTNI